MTYKGFSATDFARSATTTLAKHIRDVEEAMLRNYQLGALLEASGNVSYSNGGRGMDWPVQYRLHTIEGNTGETQRNFGRTNLWKTANLPYRGYQVTDSMFKKELKENRGAEGVVKVFENMTKRLTTSMKQGLGTQYYVDGTTAANSQGWHGLESMFGTNAQTYNISGGAAREANVADQAGVPVNTYAGLSTVPGTYGGDNESGESWPNGIADSEFDFWAPLWINYGSSEFGGSSTFATNGDEVLRYGIIHCQRNASKSEQITNVILARDLYQDFLNLIDEKERIAISSEHQLRALGFRNVVNFDGVEVSWEVGVPGGAGYGLNYDCIELKSMDDTLLVPEGPEYDIHSQSYNAVVGTLSNLCFDSPRNFFKVQNLKDS